MKHFFAVFLLLCSAQSGLAQETTLAFQVGPHMVVEDNHIGFGGALDLQFSKLPVTVSPFFNRTSGEGLSRSYYGLDLYFSKSLKKSGAYFGAGFGSANWSFDEESRQATIFDVLLGFRIRGTSSMGFYGEVHYYYNTQTNDDTDIFNESSENGFRTPIPPFLFDNDLGLSVGFTWIIK